MSNIYGELPTGDIVFAACDSTYFEEHGPSFIYSLNDINRDVHIHVVNPTPGVYSLAAILNATTEVNVTYSFNEMTFKNWPRDSIRVYYACLRFLIAPILLRAVTRLLISDIDCVFMKHFEFPEQSIGFFPREPLSDTIGWEREGTKVAAGAVYFHKDAIQQAQKVEEAIAIKPLNWFVDQIALSEVLNDLRDVHHFDKKFLDWKFEDDTVIWTGKGSRKYENKSYVAKKHEFNRLAGSVSHIDHVILFPRLDCSFKNTGTFVRTNEWPQIRSHWTNFAMWLYKDITEQHHKNPLIIAAPRWMFNNSIENYFHQFTHFWAPHVEKHNFKGGNNTKYYMQTVFPWLFTIDDKGWGGGASFVNTFNSTNSYDEEAFNKMREYVLDGNSKFAQPQKRCSEFDFDIFVPLQLPHDETIKWHSDIEVDDFVRELCVWAHSRNKKICFKGHPVNLASMEPLKKIISEYENVTYVTDIHIHDLIESAEVVYVINSGVGQEAMLLQQPVVAFGRCEYENAVIRGDIYDLDKTWEAVEKDDYDQRIMMYMRWYDWYINQIVVDTKL